MSEPTAPPSDSPDRPESAPEGRPYEAREHESRWQAAWDENRVHESGRVDGPRRYALEMWPYPSGELHMGHVRNYTLGDVFARFWRLCGADVLHPMGWDALGLPAENQAIKEKVAPQKRTPENIARMRLQMQRLGLSYDWTRELNSSEPSYYRWNQFIFVKLLERDLVYRRQAAVNFCPGCKTVLANEQVRDDGTCWRGHPGVEQKIIPEWAFRITAYAEELLEGLDTLTAWPSRIVEQQRNWIGKSEGAQLSFALAHPERPLKTARTLEVFTTRPDTLMGVTYVVLAPEHGLVDELMSELTPAAQARVRTFVAEVAAQDPAERTAPNKPKEGVDTGLIAKHPITGNDLPLYLGNFVLANYGTGAVMATPGHDARDFAFAKRYALPIVEVVRAADAKPGADASSPAQELPYLGEGTLVHSGELDGMSSVDARARVVARAEAEGFGKKVVMWHLRDWGFSRQRYWGTPIPIIYCDEHGAVPVPTEELPVVLPDFEEVELTGTGGAPLGRLESFVRAPCPTCGKMGRREIDTMDTFVDSAWYFARYLSPEKTDGPIDAPEAEKWLPADLYVGGPEHAVLHLLYFRFFTRALRDLGLLSIDEPVARLLTQGMVHAQSYRCPKHGYQPASEFAGSRTAPQCPECKLPLVVATEKMSKSKYNGVDPMQLIDTYGADTARLYVLFAAPPEKDLEWSHEGVEGLARFVQRVWRLTLAQSPAAEQAHQAATSFAGLAKTDTLMRRQLHRTLERVGHEYSGRNHFNTAIAALMALVNVAYEQRLGDGQVTLAPEVAREWLSVFAQMLAPLAPHLAESVWHAAGNASLVASSRWPTVDAAALVDDEVMYVVQVSGKLRGEIRVARDASREDILAAAKAEPNVARHLGSLSIVKEIVVPNRLVNLVVRA